MKTFAFIFVFLIAILTISFGQDRRENTLHRMNRTSRFGPVLGYETRYGGFPQVGLWYFKPASSAATDMRWWRVQATYGWNKDYRTINLLGIYNFLILGAGLNTNVLFDNGGNMIWSLQPEIDIDLVYFTILFGYNVTINEPHLNNAFNLTLQIDPISLIDAFRKSK